MVSKSINKHGNNAYSTFGHTRYFYPIGNGVKINHYFPGKDYNYQEPKNHHKVEKENKPITEDIETENVEPKMVLVEAGNQVMLHEPMQAVEPKDTPTVKTEEGDTSIKVMPVVSMLMQNKMPVEINSESSQNGKVMTVVDKAESRSLKELVETNKDQKSQKEEPSPDSEVASSYYQSRIYYIGY